MRVPTTDYSPLINAKRTETQAKRSQFIAPQIDYQTKSLQLQEKGLDRTISHITTQNDITNLHFMYETVKTMAESVFSAVAAKQMAASQAMGNGMAQQYQTKMAQMVADGEMYVDTSVDYDPTDAEGGVTSAHIVGMDKLEKFQNEQIEQIKSQGWMPKIEQQTISAMQSIYSSGQNKMLQDFYAKETADRYKLEQVNLQNAINADSAETNFTDHRNVDGFFANLKGYTPQAMAMMMNSAHAQVDLNRASDTVRMTATNQGTQAAVDYANAVSDQRGYGVDTRNKLIGYAHSAGTQAKQAAMSQGIQFMENALANPEFDGTSTWNEAKQNISSMPEEQREAYEDGMKKMQLGYLTPLYADESKDNPDYMTETELEDKIEKIDSLKSKFSGSTATEALFDKLRGKYSDELHDRRDKADKEETQKKKDMALLEWDSKLSDPEQLAKIKEEDIMGDERLSVRERMTVRNSYRSQVGTLAKLTEAERKEKEKNFVAQSDALVDYLAPLILSGQMTVDDGMALINDTFIDAHQRKVNGEISDISEMKVNTTGLKLMNRIKDDIKSKHKEKFSQLEKMISKDVLAWDKETVKAVGDQATALMQIQSQTEQAFLAKLCQSPNMSDKEANEAIESIRKAYVGETFKILNKPSLVSMKVTQEEAAMKKTAQFEDMGDSLVYKDPDTKELVISPVFEEKYGGAMKIERDMLRNNYGIDVKDKYTLVEQMDEDGEMKTVPMFEDKNGNRYIVMDNQVYTKYKHFIAPVEQRKPFEHKGYEKIDGVTRHLMLDANAGQSAGSTANQELYQELR